MRITRAVIVAGVVALLVSGTAAAQDTPAAVNRTYSAVARNGDLILKFAFPRARFSSVAGCEWSETTSGYQLTCKLLFSDPDGDPESRVLHFRTNGRGLITEIRDGGGNGNWPAFATAWLFRRVLVGLAQRQLADEDKANDEFLQFLANSPEPEQILAFVLNVKIRTL